MGFALRRRARTSADFTGSGTLDRNGAGYPWPLPPRDLSREAPIVIDAGPRSGEIGGVERVTLEMAARLPRIHPDRYGVMRPQPRLAHRAGHVWEQAVLPVAA